MKKEIAKEKESSRAETEHSLQRTIKLTGPIHADDEEDSDWLHRSDGFIRDSDVGQGANGPMEHLVYGNTNYNSGTNASVDKDQVLAYHSNNIGAEIIEPASGNNLRRDDITVIQEESNNEGIGVPDTVVPGSTQATDPKERRWERDRARRASLSTQQRALINQCRHEAYHAKKTQLTEESIERERQRNRTPARRKSKREYRHRMKEERANTLHPESLVMENPQFVPEIIFTTTLIPIPSAHEWAIPDINHRPVYIESSAEPETAAENTEIHCSPKPLRNNVPRGE
ncbi:hypothetical protein C2845_PM13G03510 [Panicum miliaceum]|uniref:Uncharacterized protein n=1 Tax=Panicum miliaceum TaxID=4540 RepID=A0A3L6RLT8_PANMI|nr:hypothetical protein C2845_PM13G03510 [Panicum miliaceum]